MGDLKRGRRYTRFFPIQIYKLIKHYPTHSPMLKKIIKLFNKGIGWANVQFIDRYGWDKSVYTPFILNFPKDLCTRINGIFKTKNVYEKLTTMEKTISD